MLKLNTYRRAIDLDSPTHIRLVEDWRNLVAPVLGRLGVDPSSDDLGHQIAALWGALAPVPANALDDEVVAAVEQISTGLSSLRLITNTHAIPTIGAERYSAGAAVALWTGDITSLSADAIVNAANQQMLGCRIPNHACIDNAIHSFAGPRLRDDCATLIELQGHEEPIGTAKITRAYALPSRYVLHTVGPRLIPGAVPSASERRQLGDSYRACLDLAAEVEDIATVAFCGISTGVFAFPQEEAARIALATIGSWVDEHPNRFTKIIIDCYTPANAAIYEEILHGQN